jgi:hypothetical protein
VTIKQIIVTGLAILLGSTIYHFAMGTDPAKAGGIFGGNFAMLVCMILNAWLISLQKR